jgi:energy-coupling factor transport system permease protein
MLGLCVAHNIILDKGRSLRPRIIFYLAIGAAVFLLTPLPFFSGSRGSVILFYMLGNPVTLESVVYGLVFALRLVALLITFNAFNLVVNPEKFAYLFSRVAEQSSFVVTLGLRLIPTLLRRLSEISDIRKSERRGIPGSTEKRGVKTKIKDAMNITSALVTWSLEDAVITAQSMRSRGYGVKLRQKNGRTFYFPYKFRKKDALFISCNIIFSGLFVFSFIKYPAQADYQIYPSFSGTIPEIFSSPVFFVNLAFLVLASALPVFVEIISFIKWSFIYNAHNRI